MSIHLSSQCASHGDSYNYSCDFYHKASLEASEKVSQAASQAASHSEIYEDIKYMMKERQDMM